MTRLVLPPNSAGGAPEITSSDWTELEGGWLEKTLLCWSVIGWRRWAEGVDAGSPWPWKRPLESAATPGEERVTSELSADDWLSSGSLSKEPRSMSVWKLESDSSRSVAVTLTTVDDSPTVRVGLTATGTVDRTSTSS